MNNFISLGLACLFFFSIFTTPADATDITCWFPPSWLAKSSQAKVITDALSDHSGLTIRPRIAPSYPEILRSFASDQANIVYVGSFVQAIIKDRGIGVPLAQNKNGKEFYSGVLVYPKGLDPAAILKNDPEKIAFAKGASSGESSAKAATVGKAAMPTPNHDATCKAVEAGAAKAGVVKNWWWEANKQNHPGLDMYKIPDISIEKNPDNVLTASNAISAEDRQKIVAAAIAAKNTFGAPEMVPFDASSLDFSIELMKKGNIDPHNYQW